MGLDMYLRKKILVGAEYDHREVRGKIDITVRGKKLDVDLSRVYEIVETVHYWRKANQIHNWFVQNVQNGVDDCGTYFVSTEDLRALRDLCEKVVKTKDATLLPPVSGFFFGSTEVDDGYYEDLKDTIKALGRLNLDDPGNIVDSPTYAYNASW